MPGASKQPGPCISMAILSGEGTFAPFERVKYASDGTATHAVAGDTGIGSVAEAYNPNTDGGGIGCDLDRMGGTQIGIAAGAITAGGFVYGAAAGKLSATPVGSAVGIAITAASTSGDRFEFAPFQNAGSSFRLVAAGTALTASSTETSLGSHTIPANRLRVGSRIRVRAQVIATATNSTDTLTLKLYIGGLAGLLICTTGAVDVANNDIGYIDAELVVRTATTAVAAGVQGLGVEGTVTAKPFKMASGTIAINVANDITVSGTWSTTNGGNSCRIDVLDVDIID